jgi:hypothetical protein
MKCKCNKELPKQNTSGFCNHCRDRSGEKNPFYGKKHKKEILEQAKIKISRSLVKKWKEENEYREKVIKGISEPRSKEFGDNQSKRILLWYKEHPEQRTLRSEIMTKSWKEGKIVYDANNSSNSNNFR